MSGSAAVLALTLVGLMFLLSASWLLSSYRDWKADQSDVVKKRKRGRLATPGFTCCSILAVVFGGLMLIFVQQLRSDVSLFSYDPWQELELGSETWDEKVIKKAYRSLSLKYHPDKQGGDAKRFQRIARAYHTLTDNKAKKNFLEYGNPEGTMLNFAEMPSWLRGDSGTDKQSAADASKRRAAFILGGLVTVLLIVPVLGMCIVKNRSLLNQLETGGQEMDPVEGLARLPPQKRKDFVRQFQKAYEEGQVDETEYKEWMEILALAEKRAVDLAREEQEAAQANNKKGKGNGANAGQGPQAKAGNGGQQQGKGQAQGTPKSEAKAS